MNWLNMVLVVYALLNIGGGIAGYVEKHSIPSVISGTLAGILTLVGIYLASTNSKMYAICLVVAVVDLGFFGPKLFKAFALWPAGIMVIASIAVLVCLIAAHFWSKGTA